MLESEATNHLPVEYETGIEYEVEYLMGIRIVLESGHPSEIQYLVKWVHYPDRFNSWEADGDVFCSTTSRPFNKVKSVIETITYDQLMERMDE